MWAVIGLGNPGKEYIGTRHNIGFALMKKIAKENNTRLKKRKCLSKFNNIELSGSKVMVAIPQTYMNRSGVAVERLLNTTGISPEKMIVVYDDLDVLLGEIRIRKEGSSGSHRGMQSIISEIKTTKFPRIRIGIGPLTSGCDASDFVLSRFDKEELSVVRKGMEKAQNTIEKILAGEIAEAMNIYNRRNKQKNH